MALIADEVKVAGLRCSECKLYLSILVRGVSHAFFIAAAKRVP